MKGRTLSRHRGRSGKTDLADLHISSGAADGVEHQAVVTVRRVVGKHERGVGVRRIAAGRGRQIATGQLDRIGQATGIARVPADESGVGAVQRVTGGVTFGGIVGRRQTQLTDHLCRPQVHEHVRALTFGVEVLGIVSAIKGVLNSLTARR